MKHPKVLHRTQIPQGLPITQTLITYLMLDKFHAVGWVWGVMITLITIIWIVSIYNICVEEDIKIKELT